MSGSGCEGFRVYELRVSGFEAYGLSILELRGLVCRGTGFLV